MPIGNSLALRASRDVHNKGVSCPTESVMPLYSHPTLLVDSKNVNKLTVPVGPAIVTVCTGHLRKVSKVRYTFKVVKNSLKKLHTYLINAKGFSSNLPKV